MMKSISGVETIMEKDFYYVNKTTFQCSMDSQGFSTKPDLVIGQINNRIGRGIKSVNAENFDEFVAKVGRQGYTFCPATFKDGQRNIENFQEMQLFALDFDSGITFPEVKDRADKYNLPVLFAYKTFNSKENHNRFRVSFLNDVAIPDKKVAKTMLQALMTIFPEADRQCNDISRMYY